MERKKTFTSSESKESETAEIDCSGSGSGGDGWPRDALDREFIESGIERVSHGPDTSLPSWTITK